MTATQKSLVENYRVVINEEEQYSIWREDMVIPPGWRAAGFLGTKESCLEYVADHWSDMRPLSVRKAMSGAAPGRPA